MTQDICKICGRVKNPVFPHRKCRTDELDLKAEPTVRRAVSTGRYVACLHCRILMSRDCVNCPRCGVKRV